MPKRISVDEIIAKRKDIGSDVAPIMKAAKSPASWNKDSRSARFVMNTQAPDRYSDIVVTAGIDTTEFEKNPVALLFHSSRSWPVGSWGGIEKVLKGRPPRIEGDVTLLPAGGPVPEIDQTAWMIANGGIRACSIGFRPNWDDAEMILDDEGKWAGGIQWNSCELLEASIVAVGASQAALIKDASGGDWRLARELIEEMLDNYAKTPDGLLVPRAEYEKAYRTTVDKIAEDTIAPVADVVENAVADVVDKTGDDIDYTAPVITDEVVDTFALHVKDGDLVVLRDTDELKLVIERDGAEVGVMVFPVTMTIAEVKAIQAKVAEKTVIEPEAVAPPKLDAFKIDLNVDTTEATEKLSALSALAERVGAQIAKIFGKKEVTPPEPPAPPTPEQFEAAIAKAAVVRDRLKTKRLIA